MAKNYLFTYIKDATMSYKNFNDSLNSLCSVIGNSCLEYVMADDNDELELMEDAIKAAAELIYASQYVMAEITCFSVCATYNAVTDGEARAVEYLSILNANAINYMASVDEEEEEEKESEATPAEKSDDIIFLNNCLSLWDSESWVGL